MADTVKIPIIGKTVGKRTAVIFGVGAVAVAGYGIYRYRQNSSSTMASTGVDSTDSTIDPATGYPYGSTEDQAALADQQNLGGLSGGGGNSGGGGGSNYGEQGSTITTNSQWEQAALDYLVNTVGLKSAHVSAALGRYLTGETVVQGSDNDSIINQAIASSGQPPVNGPGGYPPSIRHVAADKPPKPPVVTALAAPRLLLVDVTTNMGRLVWQAVPGANLYQILRDGEEDATQSAPLQHTAGKGAKPYTFTVTALDSTGKHSKSKPSNTVTLPALAKK